MKNTILAFALLLTSTMASADCTKKDVSLLKSTASVSNLCVTEISRSRSPAGTHCTKFVNDVQKVQARIAQGFDVVHCSNLKTATQYMNTAISNMSIITAYMGK